MASLYIIHGTGSKCWVKYRYSRIPLNRHSVDTSRMWLGRKACMYIPNEHSISSSSLSSASRNPRNSFICFLSFSLASSIMSSTSWWKLCLNDSAKLELTILSSLSNSAEQCNKDTLADLSVLQHYAHWKHYKYSTLQS